MMYKLQQEIVETLVSKLEKGELQPDRASQIAEFVINTLPDKLTDSDLEAFIPTLDNSYPELSSVVYPYLKTKEETSNKSEAAADAEALLKKGDLDAALLKLQSYLK